MKKLWSKGANVAPYNMVGLHSTLLAKEMWETPATRQLMDVTTKIHLVQGPLHIPIEGHSFQFLLPQCYETMNE